MTEWPAIIDRRYHDAVLFTLDTLLVTDSAGGQVRASTATVPMLRRLRNIGITATVYSPSRDCAHLLQQAGISDLVNATGGGIDTSPLTDRAAITTVAAHQGIHPDRCVVIDDQPSGVRAASEQGFSLVVGLRNESREAELLQSGADVVVNNLTEIEVRSGGAPLSSIADALEVFSQIKELVLGRALVVFLDFDGTLSDIVAQPDSATLADGAVAALQALAAQCPTAVISDRELTDVCGRVEVDGLWFAGSHGFELIAPDGTHHQKVAIEAVRSLDEVAAELIELRPNIQWDKGKATQWICELLAGDHAEGTEILPLYIGDDITDEDAFDFVRDGGVGIVVRHAENANRPSAASFALKNPCAVVEFIRQLAEELHEEATRPKDAWELVYEGYEPRDERLREALCTVGNGYVATRGCAPEARSSQTHYPGTYAAGVYNMLADRVAGRTVQNESLVNLPNWLSLTFRIDEGPWFNVDDSDLLSYRQVFDLRTATLTRTLRCRDSADRVTTVTQQRFASMNDPHIVAMSTTIIAENWSGTVSLRSLLDGDVTNTLVERYRSLSSTHLVASVIDEIGSDSVVLRTATSQSGIVIALAARNTTWHEDAPATARYTLVHESNRAGHDIEVSLSAGQSVTLEKIVTIFTSRDAAISEPASAAEHCLRAAERYSTLHRRHARAWDRLWDQCDVGLADGPDALRVLRLHLVHLLQTISPHTCELDAGVPARGLHGEAYRGHVFWDALFISPVLSMRLPNVAKSLLLYRYRRLNEARRAAQRAGHRGAMYPWQSSSDGSEVSQELHLNPASGRWNPDASARAHHVGLAVAYNTWQHYQVTGDRQFLIEYGAELLVEIARFWTSLARFDPGRGRFSIEGVIGPDEFHSGYPGHEYDGIDNNAYTNVMAVWVIMRAIDALDALPLRNRLELIEKVGLTTQERDRWDLNRPGFAGDSGYWIPISSWSVR